VRYAVPLFIVALLILAQPLFFGVLNAQENQPALGVAVTQLVVPEAIDGDIVVFDPTQGMYRLAKKDDGGTGFGVVVENPVLLLRTDVAETPIVDAGLAMVNVVGTNGPIGSGDPVGPSEVPGKGERAATDAPYVIGFARESFIPATEGEVGRMSVELAPGPGMPPNMDEFVMPGTDIVLGGTSRPLFGFVPRTFAALIRFLIAALFTAGALFLAYRMYTKNLVAGIASIGRNPLAQASIKTMMFANMGVIIIVTLAGLMVSALIIAL
jgi:hypothetical protein